MKESWTLWHTWLHSVIFLYRFILQGDTPTSFWASVLIHLMRAAGPVLFKSSIIFYLIRQVNICWVDFNGPLSLYAGRAEAVESLCVSNVYSLQPQYVKQWQHQIFFLQSPALNQPFIKADNCIYSYANTNPEMEMLKLLVSSWCRGGE